MIRGKFDNRLSGLRQMLKSLIIFSNENYKNKCSTPSKVFTEKGERLRRKIKSHFGSGISFGNSHTKAVLEIVGDVIGEDLTDAREREYEPVPVFTLLYMDDMPRNLNNSLEGEQFLIVYPTSNGYKTITEEPSPGTYKYFGRREHQRLKNHIHLVTDPSDILHFCETIPEEVFDTSLNHMATFYDFYEHLKDME